MERSPSQYCLQSGRIAFLTCFPPIKILGKIACDWMHGCRRILELANTLKLLAISQESLRCHHHHYHHHRCYHHRCHRRHHYDNHRHRHWCYRCGPISLQSRVVEKDKICNSFNFFLEIILIRQKFYIAPAILCKIIYF